MTNPIPTSIQSTEFLKLPWTVSYPRSGSHWLNCALEVYTHRRRVFARKVGSYDPYPLSVLPEEIPRENFMWVHSHICPLTSGDNVIYIIRDPVDVLYSHAKAEQITGDAQITTFLVNSFPRFRLHTLKWSGLAKTVIRYEEMKANPLVQFKKAVDHFGLEWDAAKATVALETASKGNLAKSAKVLRGYFHEGLESTDYALERDAFRSRFGGFIRLNVLKDGVEAVFPPQ